MTSSQKRGKKRGILPFFPRFRACRSGTMEFPYKAPFCEFSCELLDEDHCKDEG